MIEYYGNNDYRDYLMHYGVKGMKWGKRKSQRDYMIDKIDSAQRAHERFNDALFGLRDKQVNARKNFVNSVKGAAGDTKERLRKAHVNFNDRLFDARDRQRAAGQESREKLRKAHESANNKLYELRDKQAAAGERIKSSAKRAHESANDALFRARDAQVNAGRNAKEKLRKAHESADDALYRARDRHRSMTDRMYDAAEGAIDKSRERTRKRRR